MAAYHGVEVECKIAEPSHPGMKTKVYSTVPAAQRRRRSGREPAV
jgi:hypothetical protein